MKKLLALLAMLPFMALAQVVPNQAIITFNAPATRTDGSAVQGAVSYKVYQGVQGQTKTLVGTITATTATINTGLVGPNTYCWEVTATEAAPGANTESARSNEACKAFTVRGTVPVVITVQ